MNQSTSHPSDPFALRTGDLDLHFANAKFIQAVLAPTMLQGQLEGSGFFVETQHEAPTPEFVPATFLTSQGQRRGGFGAQAFILDEAGDAIAYPVSYRTFWQHKGGPDFSRTQVLAVLANGLWAVVTTPGRTPGCSSKSTASKALSNAIKNHIQWVTRQLQQAPSPCRCAFRPPVCSVYKSPMWSPTASKPWWRPAARKSWPGGVR